jgi:dTMP kinase
MPGRIGGGDELGEAAEVITDIVDAAQSGNVPNVCHERADSVRTAWDGFRRYGAAMARGRLVTIEGLDGAGKSTLAASLARAIAGRGHTVELLREPGGVEVSERLRALVKDPTLEVAPRAEALLYAAARAQLVHELLIPLLERDTFVLLDRFVDSSLAYQGAGRALGVEEVRAINLFATGGLTPDRTLLLRISPASRRARLRERATEPDRLEREDDGFFAVIAAAYDELARAEPARIRALDAAQPPEHVLREAVAAIEDLL